MRSCSAWALSIACLDWFFTALYVCNPEQVLLGVRDFTQRLRAGVVMALARMEELMCISGRLVAGNFCQEFRDHYHIYRAGWNRLCAEALAAGVCRWPQRPKQHYVEHMSLDTTPLNPRYMHNFVCEDMVPKNQMPRCQQSPSILVQTRCGQVCLAVLSQVERKRIPFFCLCRPACAHYMYIYIYIYIYTYSICECVFISRIHICKNMWFSVYCLLAQVPPNAAVSTTLRSIW